jgi:hypothetical protein
MSGGQHIHKKPQKTQEKIKINGRGDFENHPYH